MIAALVLVLFAQEPARPGDERSEFQRVEISVTALAGDEVYLDRGRESGIEPGDRLRLFPPSGPARAGKIVSVSRTSSRAELDGLDGLDIGVSGFVLVPRERLAPAAPAAEPAAEPAPSASAPAPPAPRVPEHPPWSSPPQEWDRNMPLLAPAHGMAPEERERRFRGSIGASADWTRESGDAERDFLSTTVDLGGRLENPFGHGGELGFDAEWFQRTSDIGSEDERVSRLRLDRLSYAWGGVRGARDRGEIGRFLQREFPEFGFLDGIEYTRHVGAGGLGASVGFMPEPDDEFRTGDDLQAAIFARAVSGEERRFSLGAGYQKTWHEGEADRDLVAAQLELHPFALTALSASVLVDLYTSDDTLKDSGPELTQLFVNATQRTVGGHGLGLFASRFRFPELLRNEFDDVTAEEIADAVNDRYGVDGWLELGSHVQLYGRGEGWSDQDDSGGGGRVRLTWRDAFGAGGPLLLESYASSGKFSRARGVRVAARRRLRRGSLGLGWDATEHEQETVDEMLLQHAVRADLELELGARWFLALYGESRFGDEQEGLSFGFVLQRSFGR